MFKRKKPIKPAEPIATVIDIKQTPNGVIMHCKLNEGQKLPDQIWWDAMNPVSIYGGYEPKKIDWGLLGLAALLIVIWIAFITLLFWWL